MGTVSMVTPNDFDNNTDTADGAKVKAEIENIITALNGNIDAVNLNTDCVITVKILDAAVTLAKLSASAQAKMVPVGATFDYFAAAAPSGYLLLDGNTFGSGSSGATNASDDYEDLFTLIWNELADAQAPVITGRGVNAAADWAANKRMTMPDARGRWVKVKEAGDAMGEEIVQSTKLPVIPFTDAATGSQSASHTHSGTSSGQSVTHTHSEWRTQNIGGSSGSPGGGGFTPQSTNTGNASADHTHTMTTGNQSVSHTHAVQIDGGGDAETRPDSMVMNKIIKI